MRDSTRVAVTAAVSAIVTSIVLIASGMPGSSVRAGQPDSSPRPPGTVCGSLRPDAASEVEKADLGAATACDELNSRQPH